MLYLYILHLTAHRVSCKAAGSWCLLFFAFNLINFAHKIVYRIGIENAQHNIIYSTINIALVTVPNSKQRTNEII